ncbi:MAG: alpha/beta fold hydrolase [Caulobacterales bacterium]|nr:alpha/beta fold hydrolase [Caulobacterales bacterium]
MRQFMITTRRADNPDAVGPARYLTFDDAAGPERDLGTDAVEGGWLQRLMSQFPTDTTNRVGNPTRVGDILFLVHGFNVSHASARAFHMKCAAALAAAGWTGQLVSYDWPSDGLVFAYLPDRANARAAASALVTSGISVLEAAQQADCTVNVHVLAHSMGGFVVQQAFTWAYQDVPPDWKVGQLMFAAADVDHSVFAAGQVSARMFVKHAGRLTAYCNRYDKALVVSNAKRLDLAPRMGRVGLPDDAPAMMCEVDCTAFFHGAYPGLGAELSPQTSHCFYFDQPEFWQDVVLTLAGGIDRSVFPTREPTATPNRFILKPEGADPGSYRQALLRAATSPSITPPSG